MFENGTYNIELIGDIISIYTPDKYITCIEHFHSGNKMIVGDTLPNDVYQHLRFVCEHRGGIDEYSVSNEYLYISVNVNIYKKENSQNDIKISTYRSKPEDDSVNYDKIDKVCNFIQLRQYFAAIEILDDIALSTK